MPFFRQLVRDAEFVAGHLDTGFIAKFQERHRQRGEARDSQTEVEDIALIAAAYHYTKLQKQASLNHDAGEQALNRWKMSGRAAAIKARSVIDKRGVPFRGSSE